MEALSPASAVKASAPIGGGRAPRPSQGIASLNRACDGVTARMARRACVPRARFSGLIEAHKKKENFSVLFTCSIFFSPSAQNVPFYFLRNLRLG